MTDQPKRRAGMAYVATADLGQFKPPHQPDQAERAFPGVVDKAGVKDGIARRPDLHDMVLDNPTVTADSDVRLDTGMTVREAVSRACLWWETKGRKIMREHRLKGSKNAGFFNVVDPDDPNFIPSGLIAGKPWDSLTRVEKLAVTKAWHHEHVRKPMIAQAEREARVVRTLQ